MLIKGTFHQRNEITRELKENLENNNIQHEKIQIVDMAFKGEYRKERGSPLKFNQQRISQ